MIRLLENLDNKYCRYIIKINPYFSKKKNEKVLKVIVSDDYFDTSDYAFIDSNGNIYSYSSIAKEYVEDKLNKCKIDPKSLSLDTNAEYKAYFDKPLGNFISIEKSKIKSESFNIDSSNWKQRFKGMDVYYSDKYPNYQINKAYDAYTREVWVVYNLKNRKNEFIAYSLEDAINYIENGKITRKSETLDSINESNHIDILDTDYNTGEKIFNDLIEYLNNLNQIAMDGKDYNWQPSEYNAKNLEADGEIYLVSGAYILIYSYINEWAEDYFKVFVVEASDLNVLIKQGIENIFNKYKTDKWKLIFEG